MTYIDRKVGELLAALEQTGQRENTLIVFTSDHGDVLAEWRMMQKRCFYEWSARVPLIVQFPDGAYAGRKVPEPVSLLDLLPTLLDVAGVPPETVLPVDGSNLLPWLDGRETGERTVLSEYHVEKVYAPCFMVRRGRYKYVYIHGRGRQLFDLVADPGEWRNLAGQPALQAVEAALHARLLEQFDPDLIAAAGAASVARREVIKAALERNGTHWDYAPQFDATKQYVR